MRKGTALTWCGLALLGLLALSPSRANEQDDSPATEPLVDVRGGVVAVTLSAEQVERLALQVAPAVEGTLPQATPAVARVADLAPLLELRQGLRTAQAALAAAKQRASIATRHMARLDQLALAGAAVGPDERQGAASRLGAAMADVDSSRLELEGLQQTAGYQWGARLAAELRATHSALIEELAARRRFLLLVTPGLGADWQQAPGSLQLRLPGEVLATGMTLDAAPVAAPGQGRTWWAITDAAGLRVGMALDAIPLDGPRLRGARLGDGALLWHAGHRWFYVEAGERRFERREAIEPRALGPGEWLLTGLAPGTRVVAVGAQSLLGEELRWSIPTEDDD